MPRVVNIREQKYMVPPAAYVGRPSPFGNPFKVGRDGTREEVVGKFRDYLRGHPELQRLVKEQLAGKDLYCWCAPLPCHADVLLKCAAGEEF